MLPSSAGDTATKTDGTAEGTLASLPTDSSTASPPVMIHTSKPKELRSEALHSMFGKDIKSMQKASLEKIRNLSPEAQFAFAKRAATINEKFRNEGLAAPIPGVYSRMVNGKTVLAVVSEGFFKPKHLEAVFVDGLACAPNGVVKKEDLVATLEAFKAHSSGEEDESMPNDIQKFVCKEIDRKDLIATYNNLDNMSCRNAIESIKNDDKKLSPPSELSTDVAAGKRLYAERRNAIINDDFRKMATGEVLAQAETDVAHKDDFIQKEITDRLSKAGLPTDQATVARLTRSPALDSAIVNTILAHTLEAQVSTNLNNIGVGPSQIGSLKEAYRRAFIKAYEASLKTGVTPETINTRITEAIQGAHTAAFNEIKPTVAAQPGIAKPVKTPPQPAFTLESIAELRTSALNEYENTRIRQENKSYSDICEKLKEYSAAATSKNVSKVRDNLKSFLQNHAIQNDPLNETLPALQDLLTALSCIDARTDLPKPKPGETSSSPVGAALSIFNRPVVEVKNIVSGAFGEHGSEKISKADREKIGALLDAYKKSYKTATQPFDETTLPQEFSERINDTIQEQVARDTATKQTIADLNEFLGAIHCRGKAIDLYNDYYEKTSVLHTHIVKKYLIDAAKCKALNGPLVTPPNIQTSTAAPPPPPSLPAPPPFQAPLPPSNPALPPQLFHPASSLPTQSPPHLTSTTEPSSILEEAATTPKGREPRPNHSHHLFLTNQ